MRAIIKMSLAGRVFFLLCLMLILVASPAVAGDVLSISDVQVSQGVLGPGQSVDISFRLSEDASVTIELYDPDYGRVRTLLGGAQGSAGVNTATWDGLDDSGAPVPDEAYVLAIKAVAPDGRSAVYDPTVNSGGEMLDVTITGLDEVEGGYNVNYDVTYQARVSIRAGIHQGPLMATVLNWETRSPGSYSEAWDGKDSTGQYTVMSNPDAVVYADAFTLPLSAIIVQRGVGGYAEYHNSLSVADDAIITYESFRENTLQRVANMNISKQYLVKNLLNVPISFKAYKSGDESVDLASRGITQVSGNAGLIVKVQAESLSVFNEMRYEIVFFVDNRRFDEEEDAYSPYLYVLNTSSLEDGEHWVSINMASITGQIGTYAFKLDVRNAQ